ncbi:MAG: HAD-IC family P-type ATPase [Bacteroidales bacterium]|nr:HAD-IC family P-type ATPase [Bacteroidales bacterium]HOL99100.1 HAD-IC family P-type ATPase [Bacteroidales bacterium]HPD24493.1 HAD-IC family P-type ATPase [Bacteroidales bacterium]HRT00099.1 HAD-IC family P-type ATPase [Bacteroidales bacterium]HUM33565.1 HAD-IC family P-type ATPase [Bacteroidales bacterium]
MIKNESGQWHAIEYKEVLEKLGSSIQGLGLEEVKNRRQKYGKNELIRKNRDGVLKVFWRQINNPLIWVLIGSSTLATALGKITDGLVVLAVVIVNSIIGFIQEYKAGKAIKALSKMVPENATVVRNGNVIAIPVSEIVPGDIVQISAGDRVPADMRIIQQKNLQVEEAALTGESVPSQKTTEAVNFDAVIGDRKCMVYSGTLVVSGTATAVVVNTGMNTELGKISDMLNETVDLDTPLTQKLGIIGKYLTIGIVAITVIIMVIGTYRAWGQGVLLFDALKESLIFAIALAVGAIPEGLPAVVTIALAIGVQRMAKRNAIIRKLPAVETLGSTTVICSDKTGTLTRNEMTVCELWNYNHSIQVTGVGYHKSGEFKQDGKKIDPLPEDMQLLLKKAVLCSDANVLYTANEYSISGDPTEVALVVAAAKAGISIDGLRHEIPRKDVIPFDSEKQYMATLNDNIILKGAPEVVLKRCSTHIGGVNLDIQKITSQIELLGSKGMRVLAIAQKTQNNSDEISATDIENGFEFIGLIGMIDPPRIEAIEAIKACHNAGITVKMITGDHHATARAIGMELNLSDNETVVTGVDLSKMSDAELDQIVKTSNIYARVAPEHKLRLVKALQNNNEVVAMTGDGVNDAPSLKQSNVGVAMGITGTSVSKESADIVLTDDNFSSIAAAVEEGRRVYDNLLKSLAFLLPTNLGLAFILIYGIMFFPFNPITKELLLPMLPVQLLWINLVAAIALALPLAFEVKEPNIMNRPPRKPDEALFNGFVTFRVFFVSILMTVGTIVLFKWEYAYSLTTGMAQTDALARSQSIAVTFIIFFQIFYLINCRSLKESVFKIGLFSNGFIFLGIGSILLLQAMFLYTPFMQKVFGTASLDGKGLFISFVAGSLIFVVISIEKWILRELLNK